MNFYSAEAKVIYNLRYNYNLIWRKNYESNCWSMYGYGQGQGGWRNTRHLL